MIMGINELRELKEKTWEDAKNFLNSKRANGGVMSVEDGVVYDKMSAELDKINADIARLEHLEKIENELKQPTSVSVKAPPDAVANSNTSEFRIRSTKEYYTDFINAMRGRAIGNSLIVGSDPDGGYLVPDEYERQLIDGLEEENLIRRLATTIITDSGERQIPVVASKGTAAWVEEEGDIPESDNKFGQVTLGAHKVATMIKISVELMKDSAFNMESYIAAEFARRIGVKEEEAFVVGDGNKKPTGILAASGGANVAVTAASATEITLDEVLDLFYSLKSPYRDKAVFIANDLTMKEIRKLKDNNGQYLWQPAIREGTPDTIVGKSIYTSSFVPQMEAGKKSLIFGDLKYYWIADRQSRTFQRLNEVYAKNGQVGFVAFQRVDGKLILPEAVQCLKMGAGS